MNELEKQDVIVVELTREECHCIHSLADYARGFKTTYYRNHKDLVETVDDKMTCGYNCLFCSKNLVECECIIQRGSRQEISK